MLVKSSALEKTAVIPLARASCSVGHRAISLLELNYLVYHGIPDKLPNRVKIELHQNSCPVRLNRLNGYAHKWSYFLAALSFR